MKRYVKEFINDMLEKWSFSPDDFRIRKAAYTSMLNLYEKGYISSTEAIRRILDYESDTKEDISAFTGFK